MPLLTILQQFHRWRLGITDPQPLELPNRSIVGRRYQILCQLGQGSVERTYLAEDRYLKGSWCVLKEFVPRLLNQRALAEGRERFEQEVSLLRDLEHPQLPEFREVLECQFEGLNRWIVVQEWLEGLSYFDLVKSRPFTEADVIKFLQEVLPALNYLHQQEPPVIHGNLSAETILHSSEMDKPILINFGTLKHIAHSIADPYADPVAPRLRLYRPADQLNGQLNPTTDLYALAVTVLTMLTGCANPREFFDRRRGEWTWAEHAAVSVGLVVILDRMLHPDPAARYQSGGEVQAALNAIHSRLPVPKPEPPTVFLPTAELGLAKRGSANLTVASPMPAMVKEIGLRLLPSAPSLAQVNQTVTVVVQQAGLVVARGVVGGLQRSGEGMRSQLTRIRKVPPKQLANVALGSVVWLVLGCFVLLTGYTGIRLWRWLGSEPRVEAITASIESRQERELRASQFLQEQDLDRCDVGLARRFRQMEGASWVEVDRQFQAGFPNFEGPIDVYNPDHAFYLQEWCYFANQWLKQLGV